MSVCVRPMLDIPDALLLLEETEGALDPSFGIMQDAWLSPSALIKVHTPDRRKQVRETDRNTDRNKLCVSEE